MTEVSGRTAFITGGASGIGLGIARALAEAGAKIALADIDAAALETAKAEFAPKTEVEIVELDVRDREAFVRAADEIEARLGSVSLLFNNAGVSGAGLPAAKMTYAQWDWGVGINLVGVINGTQTFLPRIVQRGQGGHIVNTASGAGLAATGSGVLYCTTKFAVVGMAETLFNELQPLGIGASVLCPGPVATNIVDNSRRSQPELGPLLSEDERAKIAERAAMAKTFLSQGVSIDEVGQMVLRAVRANQLHILTDRIMLPYIEARQRQLLAAMPPEHQ